MHRDDFDIEDLQTLRQSELLNDIESISGDIKDINEMSHSRLLLSDGDSSVFGQLGDGGGDILNKGRVGLELASDLTHQADGQKGIDTGDTSVNALSAKARRKLLASKVKSIKGKNTQASGFAKKAKLGQKISPKKSKVNAFSGLGKSSSKSGRVANEKAAARANRKIQQRNTTNIAVRRGFFQKLRITERKVLASVGKALGSSALPVLGLLLVFVLVMVGAQTCTGAFLGIISDTTQDSKIGDLEGNAKIVAEYLFDKGLDEIRVAAILANMKAESGIEPDRTEAGSGIGYGICQWSFGRRSALESFAIKTGREVSDISCQLDFFWEEYSGNWAGNYLIGAGSFDPPAGTRVFGSKTGFENATEVADATKQFCYGWERPGIPHESVRLRYAEEFLSMIQASSEGTGQFTHPCPNSTITCYFGVADGWTGAPHRGMDFGAPSGTPIYAADSGSVTFAGYHPSYGNYVRIDHGSGLVSLYAHCLTLDVSIGQNVKKGSRIATVGSTGDSTGPHLHFEVQLNGVLKDPRVYLGI